MTDDRLPTELIVAAALRDCGARAVPAYVLHKGAAASGTIVVKIVTRARGCRLQSQMRDMDGRLRWENIYDDDLIAETRADEYIQRTRARDPDVWVIEIEDDKAINPFDLTA